MRAPDSRYPSPVRGRPGRRASGGDGWRWGLPLALSLMAVAAASGQEVAVRVREKGRVDVRATAAPLASVLGRLATLTDMTVAYLGPPPGRLASLEISAASQADAVLDVLHRFGADFAVSMDSAGTRILTVVVGEAPTGTHPDAVALTLEPPPVPEETPPDTAPPGATAPDASSDETPPETPPPDPSPATTERGSPESEGHTTTEGFPVLPGTFVPGARATGQTTEWGVPPFVLPDPPGPKATDPGGAKAPSEPAPAGAGSPSPAPPQP